MRDGQTAKRLLTIAFWHCNINYTMSNKLPITDMLRRTIKESGIPFLTLEQETGVLRQSLMKFARGDGTIHLDAADKLAEFFKLELGSARRKPAKKAAPKKKGS